MGGLLGTADLEKRWGYTRQGIHKLSHKPDFPAPLATINRGRTRIWRSADIEAYERDRPELRSESAKQRKQTGFYLARLKG